MQFIIVGNPENRRVQVFGDTVKQLALGECTVWPYETCLTTAAIPPVAPGSIIKIESPGENSTVRQLLIERGWRVTGNRESTLSHKHGLIQQMPAWYAGYCDWLNAFHQLLHQQPGVQLMNTVADIKMQFNKPVCQSWLQQNNIPVPYRVSTISGYDELLQQMQAHGVKQVFIKPAHASSASGVIAFRKSGNKVQAVTSVELVRTGNNIQLYNSLTVRTYTNEQEVAALVDRMAVENIFAEAWLPKATLNGRYFDVRVLVINGKARHTVIRTSNTILTNLHLGNQRGDRQQFLDRFGAPTMAAIHRQAEATAACFPDSLYMGIDLLLTPDAKAIYVLEVNAFGDLLPGLLHNDETCYEAEINAIIHKTQHKHDAEYIR